MAYRIKTLKEFESGWGSGWREQVLVEWTSAMDVLFGTTIDDDLATYLTNVGYPATKTLGKDGMRKLKKPLVANKIKRQLQSAIDDAEKNVDEALMAIQAAREDIENYDVNKILKAQKTIVDNKSLQILIQTEYKDLFGVDMPTLQ